MSLHTRIEWADATFNPWLGCTKVSPACDHCYAEAFAKRYGWATWGAGQARKRTSESYWRQPLAWDRKAAKAGKPLRVFCASLADVFDAEAPDSWRDGLFQVIDETPHLIWMLLTKRPKVMRNYLGDELPRPNVWLGSTVENQAMADLRIPLLLETPAAKRFVSMEPLLGPVDLSKWIGGVHHHPDNDVTNPAVRALVYAARRAMGPTIDWVIAGGESGAHARPSHPEWFRALRDQCAAAGVPFHFKQWGEFVTEDQSPDDITLPGESRGPWAVWNPKRERWGGDDTQVYRVGKKASGRLLDGREWNEVPT